ncbi:hypothetical protein ACA910_016125 [Epithemia clementina (nom. ined.)]
MQALPSAYALENRRSSVDNGGSSRRVGEASPRTRYCGAPAYSSKFYLVPSFSSSSSSTTESLDGTTERSQHRFVSTENLRPRTPREEIGKTRAYSSPSPSSSRRNKKKQSPFTNTNTAASSGKINIVNYKDMRELLGRRDIDNATDADLVPFCVTTQIPGNRWKALFLVPIHLVNRLTKYPIVCRGSMFELRQEEIMFGSTSSQLLIAEGSRTVFLKAEFVSPYPEELALAIAQRLTKRIDQAKEDHAAEIQQQRQEEEERQRRRQINQYSKYTKGQYHRGVGNGGAGHSTISDILFGL